MHEIDRALARLSRQLPLAERQAALPSRHLVLHREILEGFASHGRAPAVAAGARDTGSVVQRLADDDLIVLEAGEVVGAYPFSAEPTPHRIVVDGRASYAMCSLDAVAIAPVFDREVSIDSSCAVTGTPIRIHQQGRSVLFAEPENLRLGIRWSEPDGCAARSMCREMVFLADPVIAESWRGPDVDSAGIFDLEDGIEFGYRFFRPLLG